MRRGWKRCEKGVGEVGVGRRRKEGKIKRGK